MESTTTIIDAIDKWVQLARENDTGSPIERANALAIALTFLMEFVTETLPVLLLLQAVGSLPQSVRE